MQINNHDIMYFQILSHQKVYVTINYYQLERSVLGRGYMPDGENDRVEVLMAPMRLVGVV